MKIARPMDYAEQREFHLAMAGGNYRPSAKNTRAVAQPKANISIASTLEHPTGQALLQYNISNGSIILSTL